MPRFRVAFGPSARRPDFLAYKANTNNTEKCAAVETTRGAMGLERKRGHDYTRHRVGRSSGSLHCHPTLLRVLWWWVGVWKDK